jgi:protein-tyrosine-phosphatase
MSTFWRWQNHALGNQQPARGRSRDVEKHPQGHKSGHSAKKKVRVLFVCLGNACRSPIAEAIARREARDIIEPSSAGLIPLGRIPELTLEVLLQNGYSAQGLESKPIRQDVWDGADLVINLSGRFKENTWSNHHKVEDWQVADPYGGTPTTYQRILVEIEGHVRKLAARLRQEQVKRSAKSAGS